VTVSYGVGGLNNTSERDFAERDLRPSLSNGAGGEPREPSELPPSPGIYYVQAVDTSRTLQTSATGALTTAFGFNDLMKFSVQPSIGGDSSSFVVENLVTRGRIHSAASTPLLTTKAFSPTVITIVRQDVRDPPGTFVMKIGGKYIDTTEDNNVRLTLHAARWLFFPVGTDKDYNV